LYITKKTFYNLKTLNILKLNCKYAKLAYTTKN